MNKAISIKIPEPCVASWNEMIPLEGKRFCSACQKTVIDFSDLTNAEIISTLMTQQSVCGRFRQSQLDQLSYQLLKMPSNGSWRRYMGVFAITASLFFQGCDEPEMGLGKVIIDTSKTADNQTPSKIYGYLYDEFNGPIAGRKVAIAGSDLSSLTNNTGRYEICVNSSNLSQYKELSVVNGVEENRFKINPLSERQDTIRIAIPEVMISGLIMIEPSNKK